MTVNEIVKGRISKLTQDEIRKLIDYADYLIYQRELQEDQKLAKKIRKRIEDEYLTVNEANKILNNKDDVGKSA